MWQHKILLLTTQNDCCELWIIWPSKILFLLIVWQKSVAPVFHCTRRAWIMVSSLGADRTGHIPSNGFLGVKILSCNGLLPSSLHHSCSAAQQFLWWMHRCWCVFVTDRRTKKQTYSMRIDVFETQKCPKLPYASHQMMMIPMPGVSLVA